MCGFTGIVLQNGDQVDQNQLEKSLKLIKHRGPDSTNIYIDKHLAFGHHRLSIFDTSVKGDQPMTSGNYTIVFNGAIYNFPELKKELPSFDFKSNSDTEVILAAYERWGPSCVNKFNGQWAFAIYDRKKNEVFCSRDRYGIKPFYYIKNSSGFYFASEIKAFTSYPFWRPVENIASCQDFLSNGIHNHSDSTFFKNVNCLAPGTNLTVKIDSQKTTSEKYYNPKYDNIPVSFEIAKSSFQQHFTNSLEKRTRANVPLGVSLSGGLDSASIACGINLLKNQNPINTVSAVYHEKKYSEENNISLIADYIGSINTKTLINEEDVTKNLSQIIWHHDQPIASMSVVAQYLNFENASNKKLKVMLGGQGADETLLGYDSFLKVSFNELQNPLRKIQYALAAALRTPDLISKIYKPTLNQNWLKSNNTQKEDTPLGTRALSIKYITHSVLPALLHYEDRNAMAHGIESRVPFLDHELVDFILTIPTAYLIKNGIRKYLLRESLKQSLPPVIYKDNNKKPFISPQAYWINSNRDYYVKEILARTKLINHLVNIDKLQGLDHASLFRILAYALWREKFFS